MNQAVEVQKLSIALLQRKLKVTQAEAKRIVDQINKQATKVNR